MPTLMDYEIEGVVKEGSKLDFAKEKLVVHAFVQEKEIAQAEVDNSGHYKLTFRCDDIPATKLWVTAARTPDAPFKAEDALTLPEFTIKGTHGIARLDFVVFGPLKISGGVGTDGNWGAGFTDIDVLPGAKMDFVVSYLDANGTWRQRYVGSTITQGPRVMHPDMRGLSPYSFEIPWQIFRLPPTPVDWQYHLLWVNISQQVNNSWKLIFDVAICWGNIPPNGEMDFLVKSAYLVSQQQVKAVAA
jgi:hypothetical protein